MAPITGNRKYYGFLITEGLILAVVMFAIFEKVSLDGDNIQTLCMLIFAVYAFFVGGNVGEWIFNKGGSIKIAPQKEEAAK